MECRDFLLLGKKKKKNYESSLYSRKWTVTQQDQYEEKIEHKGPK